MYKGEGERPEREGGKELVQRADKPPSMGVRESTQSCRKVSTLKDSRKTYFSCYFLLDLLTVSLAVFPYKSTCGDSTAEIQLPQSGSVSPVQLYKDKITSTGLLRKLLG